MDQKKIRNNVSQTSNEQLFVFKALNLQFLNGRYVRGSYCGIWCAEGLFVHVGC